MVRQVIFVELVEREVVEGHDLIEYPEENVRVHWELNVNEGDVRDVLHRVDEAEDQVGGDGAAGSQ